MGSPLPLAGRSILVVEDDYFISDQLSRILAGYGADVVGPLGKLRQAMEQLSLRDFDTAVIDINLHGEMAYPLADELVRRNTPFLFVTGYPRSVIPERFANVRCCEKPVDAQLIADEIAHFFVGQKSV